MDTTSTRFHAVKQQGAKAEDSTDPLDAVRRALDAADAPLPLAELARMAGLSEGHLQRRFRARFGLSPAEYADQRRRARLRQRLRSGASVTDAVYAAGYGAPSRVYEHSDAVLGMTPGRYRAGGAGMEIRYTLVDTALGRALVAVTERGVCAVELGDDDAALAAGLVREFPRARIERVDAGRDEYLGPLLAQVVAALAGSAVDGVPLDVVGTAFQRRVWQALLAIPSGETRSYAEVAQLLGQPRGARAVARACAGNRLAVLVPCHRVLRGDGSLGGYRWGLPRKQALLASERAACTLAAEPA